MDGLPENGAAERSRYERWFNSSIDVGQLRLYALCTNKEVDMRTMVVNSGNGHGLRIPKSLAQEARIPEGSSVDWSMEYGRLFIRVATHPGVSLEELLDGITAENLHSEIDSGGSVGGEEW